MHRQTLRAVAGGRKKGRPNPFPNGRRIASRPTNLAECHYILRAQINRASRTIKGCGRTGLETCSTAQGNIRFCVRARNTLVQRVILGRMRSNIGRIVLTLIAASVAAQAGVVSGRVTDRQGKAVVGATVRLVLPDGSAVAETKTDDVGEYSFRQVMKRVETSLGAAGKSACATRLVVSAKGFADVTTDVASG